MADLLFEIFSEEIPARMQVPAVENLRRTFEDKLKATGIFYRSCKSFVTPRRLFLFADGLSLTQEDSMIERKGPRVDADKNAIDGFLRSTGLSLDQLTVKETPKGNFYFAIIRQKGRQTREILKEVLSDIMENFSWPKSMRWADHKTRWVRPIQNIACIFGNELLDLSYGPVQANDKTYGHRFLGSKAGFTINNFDQYEKELKKNFVILDQAKRRAFIQEEVLKLAGEKGLNLINDEGLLNEVTGLVEWPVVMLGEIDSSFMHLPEEVLITTLRTHQRYFCLRDKSGMLAPYFIFVANIKVNDPQKIIEGNQRVIRARLFDAKFFFKSDNEKGLESFLPKLSDMVFHASVGSMLERAERIVSLTDDIIRKIAPEKKEQAIRAATLAKADLASGLVGEFPELQGVMGYYYAMEMGEDKSVAEAIKDHYSPQGTSDKIPSNSISIAVALAEKIDALVSLYAAGERATGSKDPYALRRLTLGVIRIIEENKIPLELRPVFKKAFKLLPHALTKNLDKDILIDELTLFFADRIKNQLKGENYNQNVINCILERPEEIDIVALKEKIIILSQYIQSPQGLEAVDAFKRALNILKIEEKKDKQEYNPKPSPSLLSEGAEKTLYQALEDIDGELKAAIKHDDFRHALLVFTKLPPYINGFYDFNLINVEERKIRENRLKLSALVVDKFLKIADFDKL